MMMFCITYRYERHLLTLLRRSLMNNNENIVCLHTTSVSRVNDFEKCSKEYKSRLENGKLTALDLTHRADIIGEKSIENNHDTKNAKLDVFVRNVQFRNKRSLNQPIVGKNLVKRSVKEVAAKNRKSRTNFAEPSHQEISHGWQQMMDREKEKVESTKNSDIASANNNTKCLNNDNYHTQSEQKNIDLNTHVIYTSSNPLNKKENVKTSMFESKSKQMSLQGTKLAITSTVDSTTLSRSKQTIPLVKHQLKKLSEVEQSSLSQLLGDGKLSEALTAVETYEREGRQVPFGLLRRLCGCACTLGLVDIVLRTKVVAKKIHHHSYRKEMDLDNYIASAMCYNGDYEGSLNKMLDLFKRSHEGTKKTKDTAKQIIYHIMGSSNKKAEDMVLKFVAEVADEQNVLSPALSLWRFCFCSSVHQHQKIAEKLIENYPKLTELLSQKIYSIIKLAYENGDLDLLYRIFQLLLFHKLSDFLSPATTALLQHQCDIGDIKGANETIKFATILKIRLKPSIIQRYLSVLYHLNHPVPMSILDLKYQLPSKAMPQPAPKFVYKF